ncbi:helix-turn-helix transcriptional regulator [Kineosporia babensis]|uniref:Helix-turn-helix transcriptional regulator n=1 Tax=Kineosporia babensis TaxID=499548 RepID=A0A9X1T031_9ACTN|nr:helix-turn-helix transcriptional regulator [Kineosporia babensis]MCD5312373.1 helix-turn-helix transcriptional regulator [Kineosporia babensis]
MPTVREASELGDFLRTRRGAISPDAAGLTSYGTRRVPGLRREELAQLAGISTAYYTRLEQGQSQAASDSIIESLARALRLSKDERAHLFELARPNPTRKRARPRKPERAEPGVVQLLEAMTDVPALALGRRNDVLHWNELGHALLASHLDRGAPGGPGRPNLTRMLFLDAHTRELHRNWAEEAATAVASLRYVAAHHPDDPALAALIGELSLGSQEFAGLWARHQVRLCSSGTRLLHHPLVGDLDLSFEVLHLPDAAGTRILTHTAAPGSASAEALALLRHSTRVADLNEAVMPVEHQSLRPDADVAPGRSLS